MSFRVPTTASKSVFYGYRSTSFASSTPGTRIALTNVSAGIQLSAGDLYFGSAKNTYCVGEIQVIYSPSYQFGDIKFLQNSGAAAEGYQVRNDAANNIMMDDACYGVASSDRVGLYLDKIYNNSYTIRSDPNETRVIGFFTS